MGEIKSEIMGEKVWEKNVEVNGEIEGFRVGGEGEMEMYVGK